MNHKFNKMLELCEKESSKGFLTLNPYRMEFWEELEKKVLQCQSRADGWSKFRNYISGKGATGSPEVNRFCILLLDVMETL